MKKVNFLNIPVDNLSMKETLQLIDTAIVNGGQIHHTVINAGKVVLMQNDRELFESVVAADLINADGQAIVWASKLLGNKICERVAGIDLMVNLVEYAYKNDRKVYFFGAKEEVVKKVVDIYSNKFSSEIIAGYRNGYFEESEQEEIAKDISQSGANILFVAISSPTKEIFLSKYKEVLGSVNFIMGVGGSFDVVSGKVKRAPVWMQRSGLEWFYRLIQEPGRMWKRYLVGNLKFVLLVLKNKFNPKKSR